MIETWRAAGLRADHFMLTTLAPQGPPYLRPTAVLNPEIRLLAAAEGVYLIDLAAYTSVDDSTWVNPAFNLDGVHYSQEVRQWIAATIVAHIQHLRPRASGGLAPASPLAVDRAGR